jgi:8-oxo-dGTP pyrophosphatase MutT (NUDIX family)
MIDELKKILRNRLALPLPGSEAHFKMAHRERMLNAAKYRTPENCRKGSVLILFYQFNKTVRFPLIIRPVYDGVHSGQIGLPGGRLEDQDASLQETALRETQEEIGVLKKDVEIIGELTELYIPPSNFLVKPYIGTIDYKPLFIPDQKEVARVIEMDLEKVMDETNIGEKQVMLSNGLSILTPYFDLEGHTVWGATAMILSELKSILFEVGY